MKHTYLFKKLTFVTCLGIAYLFCNSAAYATHNYFLVESGYRYDRTVEENETINTLTGGFVSAFTEFHNIQVYELGGRALWQCASLGRFAIKADGHYGSALYGKCRLGPTLLATLEKGHTADGSVAVGYAFGDCWGIEFVPFIGGSYDFQSFSSNYNRDTGFNAFSIRLRQKTSWYGPWLGFDFYFNDCNFCLPLTFDAGYEFHYGWCKYRVRSNIGGFLNVDMPNMKGHVFHLGVLSQICDRTTLGLRVQYTSWYNSHKKRANAAPANPPVPSITNEFGLRWQSFSLSFDLGFCF